MNDVESKALALPDRARAIRVIDTESFQSAGAMLVDIKGLRGEINEAFDPTIKAANNAHKTAVAAKKRVEAPLAEAEQIIKVQMGTYQTEQERRRIAAQKRIDDETRRMEEEKRIKSAEAAEKAGMPDIAERIISAPIVVVPAKMPEIPKAEGVSFRESWKAEVVDLTALTIFAAANPGMIAMLLTVNQTSLNQMARAQKTAMQIPGVKVTCEKTVSARIGATDDLPY